MTQTRSWRLSGECVCVLEKRAGEAVKVCLADQSGAAGGQTYFGRRPDRPLGHDQLCTSEGWERERERESRKRQRHLHDHPNPNPGPNTAQSPHLQLDKQLNRSTKKEAGSRRGKVGRAGGRSWTVSVTRVSVRIVVVQRSVAHRAHTLVPLCDLDIISNVSKSNFFSPPLTGVYSS